MGAPPRSPHLALLAAAAAVAVAAAAAAAVVSVAVVAAATTTGPLAAAPAGDQRSVTPPRPPAVLDGKPAARLAGSIGVTVAKNVAKDLLRQFKKSGIVPEAIGGGAWECGSPATGASGCRTSSASVFDFVATCVKCATDVDVGALTVKAPVHGAAPQVEGSACVACGREHIHSSLCMYASWGLGSQRKGRSCRVVQAGGCWPTSSDRVLHDCGAGTECRYTVDVRPKRRVSASCCAPKETKFLRRWRNLLRCTALATSSRVGEEGAVVMWEEM